MSDNALAYFNDPDSRAELWCGNQMSAREVRWADLDDLLNRLMGMADAWDGRVERDQWKSWIHSVVLASTAARTLNHRPAGFERLDDAPDGTQWMLRIIKAKKGDDDER